VPLFAAQVFNIKHVCKVNTEVLTCLRFAKRLEQEVTGNINNFKRPSLHSDIYRVGGGGGGTPPPPPYTSLGVTLAGAEEWEENSVGGEENHKLAKRQLTTSMTFADAKTSHSTKKQLQEQEEMCKK